jgi:hypothetical protein
MICSLLLASCLIAAGPSASEPSKAEVQTLVVKLDDEHADVRSKAEEQLIKLGPAALDFLPAPESESNEQVKQALRRIRKTLQDARAQAGVAASTVAFRGRIKLSQVLGEIQKQTGNNIAAQPQPAEVPAIDPEIKVDFDKTPFWSALDQVLDQAQLSVYPYAQPGALQLVPRGPNDLPRVGRATVVGPLRIEPVRVRASRDPRTTAPSVLQVGLEIAWEPRLRPISIMQPMAAVKAVDASGAAIEVYDPQAAPEALPRPGSSALELDVALAVPLAGAKEIASLKGSLRVMMLGNTEKFSFGNLLNGKQQQKQIAAATVTLTDVRKNGDVWEINVLLRYDNAGDALESHRNWALQNKAYLKGADGKPIEPDSMETTLRTPKEIGVGYAFALNASPEKMTFVYETPGLVMTKDYAYELKGIKLP